MKKTTKRGPGKPRIENLQIAKLQYSTRLSGYVIEFLKGRDNGADTIEQALLEKYPELTYTPKCS